MFTFRKTTTGSDPRFCERCGSVCDRRCYLDAQRQRAADDFLRYGWRLT